MPPCDKFQPRKAQRSVTKKEESLYVYDKEIFSFSMELPYRRSPL